MRTLSNILSDYRLKWRSQDVKWTMCSVPLDLRVSLNFPSFASNSLKLFFLTNVRNYCEEQKRKPLVNVHIKISRKVRYNFWNLGSTFVYFLEFFLETFWFSGEHFTGLSPLNYWIHLCIACSRCCVRKHGGWIMQSKNSRKACTVPQVVTRLLFFHCALPSCSVTRTPGESVRKLNFVKAGFL